MVTLSYKRWSVSRGSVDIFNPTPFKVLTMGLLASFFVVSAPPSSSIALVTLVRNIFMVVEVPIMRLVDTVPAYGV